MAGVRSSQRTQPPHTSVGRSEAISPPTQNMGIMTSCSAPGATGARSAMNVAFARSARWVCGTPLGSALDPDVQIVMAWSPGRHEASASASKRIIER